MPSDQGGGFVQDETGALVKSHLDEAGLTAIATATGGAYVHLGGQGEDFEAFLGTVFGAVTKHDLIYRQQKNLQPALSMAAGSVLADVVGKPGGGHASLEPPASASRVAHGRAVSAVSVVMGVLIVPMRSESADQADDQSAMGDAKAPVLEYNAGTSAYRAGQFPQATQSFQQSIKVAPASDAKRLADQEDAYYNLGNALYRAGQQLEKSAPQEAMQKWTEAVKAYDTALQLRADDADSKYNRDFVNRKIDALRQPPDQGGGGGRGKARAKVEDKVKARDKAMVRTRLDRRGNPHRKGSHRSRRRTGDAAPADGENDEEAGSQVAEDQRPPGQMSAEEARELLDSAKSDEHHSLAVPTGPRDPDQRRIKHSRIGDANRSLCAGSRSLSPSSACSLRSGTRWRKRMTRWPTRP